MLADLYEIVFSFHNFKLSEQSSYCVSELIFCQHIRQKNFMLIDVNLQKKGAGDRGPYSQTPFVGSTRINGLLE